MAGERRYGRRKPVADVASVPSEKTSGVPLLYPYIIGAVAFLIYLRTMTPGMQTGDGTELAVAAHVMGIPHPTGYPLYMMLCKAWLVLTGGGDPIVRTTVLNCILMATTVGVTALILVDVLKSIWQTLAEKAVLTWAAAGALTAAFLRFHWSNAGVTEVYALQFLLMVLFTRWIQKAGNLHGITRRLLIGLTVLLALAMAHHRMSVTLVFPWAAMWVMAWRHPIWATERLPWLTAGMVLFAGASLYAYLPLRAMAQPPINWGNPVTASAFYNHVRGTEYLDRGLLKPALGQTFDGSTLAAFTRMQTTHLLSDLAGQFFPYRESLQAVPGTQKIFIRGSGLVAMASLAMVGLAAWGATWCCRSGQRLFVAGLTVVALQNVLILYVYNISDIRDYFLYPLWAVWILMFAGLATFARNIAEPRRLAIGYGAFALPILVLSANWNQCNRSEDLYAEIGSAAILPVDTTVMPKGSILLTDDDWETFTTWYRRHARNERTDVVHFAANFVYMPWYEAFFTPREQTDLGITLASGVAHSAEEYAAQLHIAIIDANIGERAVFTTINDAAVLSALSQTYNVEPVDAVEVVNRSLFDERLTTVLYRISVKDEPQ